MTDLKTHMPEFSTKPGQGLEKSDITNSGLIVEWDGDDPENVRNLSPARKWIIVVLLSLSSFHISASSSVWSMASSSIQNHFHASDQTVVLGISLFVLALATGPLFLAPLSEIYGRRMLYLVSFTGYISFQLMTAFGKNLSTMIAGRFLSALFGSGFLAINSGTIADLFAAEHIGVPMTTFTVGTFLGPGVGPVVGGFLDRYAGFRWVFYAFLIAAALIAVLVLVLVPETYEPLLLARKAQRLRQATGRSDLMAPFELQPSTQVLQTIARSGLQPLIILVKEPVLLLLCLYTGVVMAINYFFFVAFPLVFQDLYGFEIQQVGLCFLGVTVGGVLASSFTPMWEHLRIHMHNSTLAGGDSSTAPAPELRMYQLCVGGVVLPLGLFGFAWSVYPTIPFMVPILFSGIFGFAFICIFNSILGYTVQVFGPVAATATAANVFVRCILSCALPLVGERMIRGIGYHWAISLIGFVTLLLMPSGFLFIHYGKRLRQSIKS